jgi:hypothetical protein
MVELSAFRLAVHGGVSAAGGKIFELEVPISRFYQGDQQDHRISPLRGVLAKHRGAVPWIAVMLAWAQECTRKQDYVYIFFFFFFSNVHLTAHVNATCAHTRTPGNVRVHINGGGNAPPPPSPLPTIYQHTRWCEFRSRNSVGITPPGPGYVAGAEGVTMHLIDEGPRQAMVDLSRTLRRGPRLHLHTLAQALFLMFSRRRSPLPTLPDPETAHTSVGWAASMCDR